MCLSVVAQAEPFRVIGYAMNPASPIVSEHAAKYITDLVVFSVEPHADGTVDRSNISDEVIEAAVQLKKQHGVRLQLAAGGWGRSMHFAAMSATPETRTIFIAAMLAFCQRHGFSGMDYDWEFPADPKENADYAALIVETAAAFHEKGLLVTAAVGSWQRLEAEAYEALDRVHLMTYDFPGQHATMKDTRRGVETYLKRGVPKAKLIMGVPFYGRVLADRERAVIYRTLADQHELKPWMDEVDGIYFNGPDTIAYKTRYALRQGLAGVMMWELSQDTTGDDSLIQTIHETVRSQEQD